MSISIEFRDSVISEVKDEMSTVLRTYFKSLPEGVMKLRVALYPGKLSIHPPLINIHTVRLIGENESEVIPTSHFILHYNKDRYELLKLPTPKQRADIKYAHA